jgi:hypothetical protein
MAARIELVKLPEACNDKENKRLQTIKQRKPMKRRRLGRSEFGAIGKGPELQRSEANGSVLLEASQLQRSRRL